MQIENIALRYAPKNTVNEQLFDLTEICKNRSNAYFFAEVRNRLSILDNAIVGENLNNRTFSNGLKAAIGLIGEYGLIGYTVRQAQAIIRTDKTPSYWSHSFLFHDEVPANPDDILRKQTSPIIWESTIDLASETPQLNMINGVSSRYLKDYCNHKFDIFNPHCVPNVAVIVFALNEDEIQKIISHATDPNVDQLKYDFSGLIGTWLSYIFKKQNEENPLGAGNALYCSAYCQLAYDAIGLDLATGSHSRNTSPENIWQSVKKLYSDYFNIGFPVAGFYCIRDPYCEMIPSNVKEEEFSTSLEKITKRILDKNKQKLNKRG